MRYVDSSVERLQVKVRRHDRPAYIVIAATAAACRCIRRASTGEFVAGVRYRAWQPPSCLHPTIGVHAPLVFDIFDTWSHRAIGGCTWHVSHPGGLAFETFPVNAYEAESRRGTRFQAMGHTPNQHPIAQAELQPEFPLTLDLRRAVRLAPVV